MPTFSIDIDIDADEFSKSGDSAHKTSEFRVGTLSLFYTIKLHY